MKGDNRLAEIVGTRYVHAVSSFLWRSEELTIIRGFLACPECEYTLKRNWSLNTWACPHCETVWSDRDLVQAVETEQSYTRISVRNLVE